MVAGVEITTFDHLSKPVRTEELAEKCAGLMQELQEYISILAACELANKMGGLYQNRSVAKQYLVTGLPPLLWGSNFI